MTQNKSKTFLFHVFINHGNRISQHFTNAVLSKNDGALLTFRDEKDSVFNVDPTLATIKINCDKETHIADHENIAILTTLIKEEKKKLEEFQSKYKSINSGDLQTFILGLKEGEKIIKENPYL